jgi:N-acetylmuramoyl-L-alanine amidase
VTIFKTFDRPSPNAEDRPKGQIIDTIILHYTGMESAEAALARLCDPAACVSAHYVIDEDGTRYRLVPEEKRAWHAGVACWRDETNINDRSIGIELVNPGHEFGYRPFPVEQMASLEVLALDLAARYAILPERILGHSDVAPLRKQDPGELFDWLGLAEIGLGVWPEESGTPGPDPGDIGTIQRLLHRYGYACPTTGRLDDETRAVIAAFQRHFRPARCDGLPDAETATRLADLVRRFGRPETSSGRH